MTKTVRNIILGIIGFLLIILGLVMGGVVGILLIVIGSIVGGGMVSKSRTDYEF